MQQPLAFTLVKAVVTARDEGRQLTPAFQTAWKMLRAELSPSQRDLVDQVSWGPSYQEELRIIIDQIREYFRVDPALEDEFGAFIDETEQITAQDSPRLAAPILDSRESSASSTSEDISSIPMIELEPDLEAEVAAAEAQTQVLAKASPSETQAAPIIETPTSLHPAEPEPRIDSTPSAAPAFRAHVNELESPSTLVPERNWLMWAAIALTAFIFLAMLAFFATSFFGASSSDVTEASQQEITSPTDNASDLILPVAPAVATLRDAGDLSGATAAQERHAEELKRIHAPAMVQSKALDNLAELSMSTQDYSGAVAQQLASLELLKQTLGDQSVEAGDAHLALAQYYLQTGEVHMARAHFKQGRHVLSLHPDFETPARNSTIQQLTDQLEEK